MSLITATALSVQLGGRQVLSGIDFAISRGEIVTIVGPNGSGKTSFLRALLGVVPPSRGKVSRARGLRVGYVPQRLHLDPGLPLPVTRFLCLPRRQSKAAMQEVLEHVGLGAGVMGQNMATLSGGQFQRVLLARALLGSPDILMLDEPTAGLDQPGTAAFYQLIADVRAQTGCAVLSVSHDLHVVMSASDRVICVNGHICCEGAPHVVRAAPEYRALFGLGTGGALALYQHDHDHVHDDGTDACGHDHDHSHEKDRADAG